MTTRGFRRLQSVALLPKILKSAGFKMMYFDHSVEDVGKRDYVVCA